MGVLRPTHQHIFLTLLLDVRRVSGSSPLSSTIQKALKPQRFRGFCHFIQFVALAILPNFHKKVQESPCCAIPLVQGAFYILLCQIQPFFQVQPSHHIERPRNDQIDCRRTQHAQIPYLHSAEAIASEKP